ncbi:MAG: YfhO family protein [Clostridiales bacterium]|nr:YfhO family protein [Clostridiales bacterium]
MMRSRNKLFRKYCEGQFYIYSFFIPAFIMFIVFLILQVHPLGAGTNMVLTVDCYHQYAPFLVELRNKILSGESLFFSWNVGMGTNFWAVFANYSASPLNILALLFPPKYVGDCIALIAIIRVGLTGLFMSILLKEFDKKRKDLLLVAFSSSYALCGWVASYFWNIMWHDAVMLLPLIVYGLIRMMRDKKPLLYCLTLAVCLISNFYAGYFVCLFLVFYAPILYVSITERITIKNFWAAAWRFAVYSGIAGGISAFLTLSTYFTLQKSSATGGTFPKEFQVTNDMFDFISRFFVGSNPNIRDGMANVYCGILIVMLLPLYFLCKKIRLREKIAYGIGLAIMYISLSSRMMTYIWHGFHFPNQIPYRQAFLISFLVVIMGYKVLRNLKSFSKGELMVPCLSMIAFLILYEKIGEGQEGYIAMGISIVFIIVYTALLRMIANGKKSAMFQQIALFFVLVAEIFTATAVTVSLVAAHEGFTGWDFYGSHYDEIQTMLKESEAQSPFGFERSEIYPAYICNQPALYNMKGISIFTSTARESFVKFINNLGFHNNGINSMRNFGLTEVTGTLFGVKNMYDLYKTSPIPVCFQQVETGSELRHFVNPDALSVGYMVDPGILEYHMNQTSVPFLSNNAFVNSMGIEGNVFEPMEVNINSATGVKDGGGNERTGYKYTFEESKAEIMLTVKDAKPGDHLYLYVVANKAPQVVINDQLKHSTDVSETKYTARTYQFMDLGYCEKNTNKLVTLKFNDSKLTGNLWIQCARVSEDAYKEMVEKLSDEQMKVLSYDSTHMEGVITAEKDGVLFLTIPYDESWVATVDGQKADIENVDNAFMALRLSAGTHNISLSYHPARFTFCCYITYVALGALVFLTICRKILEYIDLKEKYAEKEPAHEVDAAASASDSEAENVPEDVEKAPETEAQTEAQTDAEAKPEEPKEE